MTQKELKQTLFYPFFKLIKVYKKIKKEKEDYIY